MDKKHRKFCQKLPTNKLISDDQNKEFNGIKHTQPSGKLRLQKKIKLKFLNKYYQTRASKIFAFDLFGKITEHLDKKMDFSLFL